MSLFDIRKVFATALTAGAIAVAGIAGPTPAAAEGEMAIKDRVAAMKQLGGNMKKLGAAVGGGNNADAAAAANEIASIAAQMAGLFPADSKMGDTRAKAEIWQNWADFEAKAMATEAAAKKVAADAQSGNLSGDAKAVVGSIGATCGGCHKVYRAPKQS